MKRILVSTLLSLLLFPVVAAADVFPNNTSYQVCFTPTDNCEQLIIDTIATAKQTIYVQAYTFTSKPIENALIAAKNKGVDVNIILDKSQFSTQGNSSATLFENALIPTWIDYIPAIAHNKVMIIDRQTVITGSFNFTQAAQNTHTENVIVINDTGLANRYYDNWVSRQQQSVPVKDYHQ